MPGVNVLSIHVFFHPHSVFGSRVFAGLVERLYNEENPDLELDFKVPVFQVPYREEDRRPPHFDSSQWDRYDHAIIVVVLDSYLANDPSNMDFLKELRAREAEYDNLKVVPVVQDVGIGSSAQASLFGAVNIMRPLALLSKNIVGVPESMESLLSVFYIELYHLIVKRFLNQDATRKVKKVSLFLSHTKRGGEPVMTTLRRFIQEVTQLDKFVDVYDIEVGELFEKEIQEAIAQPGTIFLTLLTDQYATRQVCKMEVLYAKELFIPILTVSALEDMERRSFPYLNNTPVIRWQNSTEGALRVIEAAMREYLRAVVAEREMLNFIAETGTEVHAQIFSPPELLTLYNLLEKFAGRQQVTVLYPGPLMDQQEEKILNKISPNIKFIIPWQIA